MAATPGEVTHICYRLFIQETPLLFIWCCIDILPGAKHVVSNGGGGKVAIQRSREKRRMEREAVTTKESDITTFLLTEKKHLCRKKRRGKMLLELLKNKSDNR